jgi:hypothetical protein
MVTRTQVVLVGVAAAAAVLLGCSGGSHTGTRTAPSAPGSAAATRQPPPDDGTRPTGVPAEAVPLRADRTFGADPATPGAPLLYLLDCRAGVLTVITSQVVRLYAELPCDRAVPQNVVDRFSGQPVRLRLAFGDAVKLYVDSPVAGTIEFTVTRTWMVE